MALSLLLELLFLAEVLSDPTRLVAAPKSPILLFHPRAAPWPRPLVVWSARPSSCTRARSTATSSVSVYCAAPGHSPALIPRRFQSLVLSPVNLRRMSGR